VEINGERVIAASEQKVWEALNDPAMLKLCIPGCESVERIDASQMKLVVMAKIGPVRARFSGKVTMTDVVSPTSYVLHFEGTGGPAGFAKGQSHVSLSAHSATETLLVFGASAAVGGKLGQIGARLIESASRAISDEFFNRLAAQLSPEGHVSTPPKQAAKPDAKQVGGENPAEPMAWLRSRWVLTCVSVVFGFILGKCS
jgi:carbon monoxide dehydrogenase subunit G